MKDLIGAEMAEYSDGAYADHGSARDSLERFASRVKADALEAQAKEIEALRDDAERYRFIRLYLSAKDFPILLGRGIRCEPDELETIDAYCDAARRK